MWEKVTTTKKNACKTFYFIFDVWRCHPSLTPQTHTHTHTHTHTLTTHLAEPRCMHSCSHTNTQILSQAFSLCLSLSLSLFISLTHIHICTEHSTQNLPAKQKAANMRPGSISRSL